MEVIKMTTGSDSCQKRYFYHVTILSNILYGYDKYRQAYSKSLLPQSTYPNVFFLLTEKDINIGINKAQKLLEKLNLPGDRLVAIETQLPIKKVHSNDITETKLGRYIAQNWIPISRIGYWAGNQIQVTGIEELVAASYKTHKIGNNSFQSLRPRSISLLPVAQGCQARCSFCFSAASISSEQEQARFSLDAAKNILNHAKIAGAERAVITGGGEPGLLSHKRLNALIALCHEHFKKVVLISNGYTLSKSEDIVNNIIQWAKSGLSVLSISRHHFDQNINAGIMNLNIDSEAISLAFQHKSIRDLPITLRWVCVLQKGGIETAEGIKKYIDWAFKNKVSQICFKELYVSASNESIYFDKQSNNWSYKHQVPLNLIVDFAERNNWQLIEALPWGSPVYRVEKNGSTMTIAAYTEPSMSWELTHQQCRSWNFMADGRCYASLESKDSQINYMDA